VRRSVKAGSRLWAGLLAVAVGLTLVATPAWAGEAPSPVAPKTLKAATAAKLAALDTNKALMLNQDAAGASAEGSKTFFRTRKGAVTAVLMVGAIAWVLVSRSQDALHSPAR
jgi:hypothetical protein